MAFRGRGIEQRRSDLQALCPPIPALAATAVLSGVLWRAARPERVRGGGAGAGGLAGGGIAASAMVKGAHRRSGSHRRGSRRCGWCHRRPRARILERREGAARGSATAPTRAPWTPASASGDSGATRPDTEAGPQALRGMRPVIRVRASQPFGRRAGARRFPGAIRRRSRARRLAGELRHGSRPRWIAREVGIGSGARRLTWQFGRCAGAERLARQLRIGPRAERDRGQLGLRPRPHRVDRRGREWLERQRLRWWQPVDASRPGDDAPRPGLPAPRSGRRPRQGSQALTRISGDPLR